MSSFSVQGFQEKLNRLTPSQDSIETLSLWVIHHKAHGKTSAAVWRDNVEKADPDRRLLLFYLANDILQNGKRKGVDVFQELFKDPLREAVMLARGEKIHTSVQRMFRIWKERKVYDNGFLRELEQLIEPPSQKSPAKSTEVKQHPDFKLSLLEDAMEELRKFEGELKVKSSLLSSLRIDVSSAESLSKLKDKSAGGKFSNEFEEASQKLQDYCECLGIEVNERINILEMLRECQKYLTLRLAEFQHTAKNFKELGATVDQVKEKLQQRLKELERAQSTATSDPSAKEDITDVGDMEIESDNETPEDTSRAGKPPPSQQGVMVHPLQQRAMMVPPVVQPGGFVQPMFQPHLFPPQLPPPPFAPRPPPHSFPQYPNSSQLPPPHVISRGTFNQNLNQNQPSPVELRKANTVSAPPVKYTQPPVQDNTAPQNATMHTATAGDPLKIKEEKAEDGDDLKSSLDERLKTLMAQKNFSKVILTDYPDSGSETDSKPYSPSTGELLISNTGSPVDDDSIPTPTMEAMTPEDASPQLNMANPILQVLFKSPPDKRVERKPPTPPPPVSTAQPPSEQNPPVLANVDTGLLQSILNNVKTVSPQGENPPHVNHPSPAPQSGPPPAVSRECVPNQTDTSPTKLLPKGAGLPKDLKITPTLTTLLDEIFPQLSKTLQNERKRKQVGNEPLESSLPTTKALRVDLQHPPTPTDDVRRHAAGNGPPGNPPFGLRAEGGMLHRPPPRPGFNPNGPIRPQFHPRTPGPPASPSGPRMLSPLRGTTEMRPIRPPFPPSTQGPASRPPFPPSVQGPTSRPPFPPSTQGPTSRPPFSPSTQGPASRPPFPPSVQGPASRPPFSPSTQGPASRPPFPPSVQGPTSRPPFPPSTQGPASRPPFPPSTQGPASRPPFPPSTQGPASRPPFNPALQGPNIRPPFPPMSQGITNRPPFPPVSQGPSQYGMRPPVGNMPPRMPPPSERMLRPAGPTANHMGGGPLSAPKQPARFPAPVNFDLNVQHQGPGYRAPQFM